MATLFPAVIPSGYNSPGERELFSKLRDDTYTQNWIVLHSLDIAQHRKQVTGEIDFVVIIPGKGVLCLEVKAGKSLYRDRGLWYYGTNPKPDSKGPFKQASDAMHSIKDRLIKQRPELSKVVFWSAVMFPYIEFTVESGEWHQWQVIDKRKYQAEPIGWLLERILTKARQYLGNKRLGWFKPESTGPSVDQCKLIAQVLRPDFECYESPKSRINKTFEEIKRYTEDQFQALDNMAANDRVIFEGPAGTGKTLLAIEFARRAKASNRKVLFICYNKILAKWLQDQTFALGPAVTTCNLHEHMARILGINLRDTSDNSYWKEELPRETIDKLSDPKARNIRFDEIIIDEAQDIFSTNYLDVLDLSLEGGLATGKWTIFGDFTTQNIFKGNDVSLDEFKRTLSGNAPIFSLRKNCRNTPRIAGLAQDLAGGTLVYSKTLRQDDGVKPEVHYYSNSEDQRILLVQCLEKLKRDKINNNDIVILSIRSNENCIASKITDQALRNRLTPYGLSTDSNRIGYCSIYKYKGMEAPVVIVTDIASFEAESKSLLYIAVTRALVQLIILASEKLRNQIPFASNNSVGSGPLAMKN